MFLCCFTSHLFYLFAVDSCKKRWKYLRERYVQQKKVGDSPSYEHLSRPYLEKMKFLDNFIQPRKSYRHVGLFPSPSAVLQHTFDGNESSKSSSSVQIVNAHLNNDNDDAYPQYYHLNQFAHANLVVKHEENAQHPIDSHKNDNHSSTTNNMPSSSSSIISQESPAMTILSNSTTNEVDEMRQMRKRRHSNSISVSDSNNLNINNHEKQILNNHLSDNDEPNSINNDGGSGHQSPSTIPTDFLYPFYQHSSRTRKTNEHLDANASTFPNPADFLHPFYQQMATRQVRHSEQLLGELVTSELYKMSKDKKKRVQKKILEILFFDDE